MSRWILTMAGLVTIPMLAAQAPAPDGAASAAPPATAQTSDVDFHSDRYGYSLELPEGWVAVPDDVLKMATDAMVSPRAPNKLTIDAAFQRAAAPHWLAYPYVMVQVVPYAHFGSSGQLPESHFATVTSTITGLDMDKVMDEALTPEARQWVDGIQMGKPALDMARRRFVYSIDMDVQGVGPVRGLMAGHFGKEALVQVMFYATPDQWDSAAAERDQTIESFAFDPATAYDPALAAESTGGGSIWDSTWRGAIIGGGVGALVGVVFAGYGAYQKRRARQ